MNENQNMYVRIYYYVYVVVCKKICTMLGPQSGS